VAPITVALRGQHVGRYGSDAGDSRLLPLVWTLRDLVRGYDAQDVMTTRRLVVANLEARVPLVGAFGRLSRANVVPVDAIVFADAGAFWSGGGASAAPPAILRSIGAGVRLNAGGFIFEVAAARALDAAPRGWRLSFNFVPGF
jgi:hemolysin activation/secretion protein